MQIESRHGKQYTVYAVEFKCRHYAYAVIDDVMYFGEGDDVEAATHEMAARYHEHCAACR